MFEDTFNLVWDQRLKKEFLEIERNETIGKLEQSKSQLANAVVHAIEQIKSSNELLENQFFQKIVLKSLCDHTRRLLNIGVRGPNFTLPDILYPHYLIHLLKCYNVIVKAIAIVDKEEHFWRGKLGDEIMNKTIENSSRVFVFMKKEHLRENLHIVKRHAKKYSVYVMSYDNLSREFTKNYDFSIIGGVETMRLLARYDDAEKREESLLKTILFTADRDEISAHEDAIIEIINSNSSFPLKNLQDQDEDEFISEVFKPPGEIMTRLDRKKVEMSAYIDPHSYDQHEEDHAYYREMMDMMINLCKEHLGSNLEIVRILELGAGTGIFTKRLATLERADISAVEIDWACFKVLEHKINNIISEELKSKGSSVRCLNKDSRDFTDCRFNYIFSSFADHHIKPDDKIGYLKNIKRNLEPSGLFIVGDEFLPSYDKTNLESRQQALRIYHNHIIEIAIKENKQEVAKLEEAALKSGLDQIGDFKISCEEYESLIKEAGFSSEKKKIGPSDRDDIGGVYVYKMWV